LLLLLLPLLLRRRLDAAAAQCLDTSARGQPLEPAADAERRRRIELG